MSHRAERAMFEWKRHVAAGAVAAVAALNGFTAESAPLVYATVTGTIQDINPGQSHDDLGFFAVPGSSLDGTAFTAKFIFDVGASNTFGSNSGTINFLAYINGLGGVTGSMTINGHSISYNSTGYLGGGEIDVGNGAPGIGDLARARVFGNYNSQSLSLDVDIQVQSMLDDFTSSTDLTAPFSYTTGANTQFVSSTLNIMEFPGGATVLANLHPETISFSTTGDPITAPFITEAQRLTRDVVAAPEPETLALLGFGLAGLGLVRRKRASP